MDEGVNEKSPQIINYSSKEKTNTMRTNIDIDDNLLKQAMKISKVKSKKELVNHALEELIRLHKMQKMLSLFGKVKWEGNLDEMRSV